MSIPVGTRALVQQIHKIRLALRAHVKRGRATIVNSYANGTCDVYLNGDTSSLIPGISYNGSVDPPNPGEEWAVDSLDGDHVAVFRLASGPGSNPQPASSSTADGPGLDAVFSYPGALPVSSPLSGCFPVRDNLGLSSVELAVTVGTTDPSNSITVQFWLNASLFATVVLNPGDQQTVQDIPVQGWGDVGDLLQVSIESYGGSAAADLVARWTAHLGVTQQGQVAGSGEYVGGGGGPPSG